MKWTCKLAEGQLLNSGTDKIIVQANVTKTPTQQIQLMKKPMKTKTWMRQMVLMRK